MPELAKENKLEIGIFSIDQVIKTICQQNFSEIFKSSKYHSAIHRVLQILRWRRKQLTNNSSMSEEQRLLDVSLVYQLKAKFCMDTITM